MGARHVWNKYTRKSAITYRETYTALDQIPTSFPVTITKGSSYSFNGATGEFTLSGVSQKTLNQNDDISGSFYFMVGNSSIGRTMYYTATQLVTYANYGDDSPYLDLWRDGKKFYATSSTTYSRGSLIGNIADDVSNAYPSNNYSGSYWYVYQGTDTIDPSAVLYDTDAPNAGNVLTISAVPVANTYGGTVSYQYEYSTDGGTSWTVIEKTTATSVALTVPDDAEQIQARVLASDGLGYTSTDYIYGATLEVSSGCTMRVPIDGVLRQTVLYAGVGGVLRPMSGFYAAVDGIQRPLS